MRLIAIGSAAILNSCIPSLEVTDEAIIQCASAHATVLHDCYSCDRDVENLRRAVDLMQRALDQPVVDPQHYDIENRLAELRSELEDKKMLLHRKRNIRGSTHQNGYSMRFLSNILKHR